MIWRLVRCIAPATVAISSVVLVLSTELPTTVHRRVVVRESVSSHDAVVDNTGQPADLASKESAIAVARDTALVHLKNICNARAVSDGRNVKAGGELTDYETEDIDCQRIPKKGAPNGFLYRCVVSLKGYCEWDEFGEPQTGGGHGAGQQKRSDESAQSSPEESVSSAIDRISHGRYQELPAPRSSTASEDQKMGWSVTNDTDYTLHVYLNGPVSREISIPSGETRSLDIPAGSYRIAASVNDPNVDPFYGRRTLPEGTRWTSTFHIGNRQ